MIIYQFAPPFFYNKKMAKPNSEKAINIINNLMRYSELEA
jgi:hypothetical protein